MANVNDNPATSATQVAKILSWMLEGHSITPLEALEMFGCFRLGARIKDIERLIGYAPLRDRVQVKNRDGKLVYVARYWICDDPINVNP